MTPQKAAVIGHPIGHTMSPFIQKRLFRLSGMPVDYQVLDVPDLPAALPDLRRLDAFNITIPHKSGIIPFLDGLCRQAELCGSVNTVRVEDGKLFGYTTDGPGAAMALSHHGLGLSGHVLLLGNGGAAKAVAFQAAAEPDFRITIAHRDQSYGKAMALAESLAEFARGRGDRNFRVTVKRYQELEDEAEPRYDLLVNTTSVGMYPKADACPVSGRVIARCGAVFDAVYNPRETMLLKTAKELGVKAVGGMGMLVCQAACSHKIWYGTAFRQEDLLGLIEDAQAELERLFGGAG